MTNSEIAQLLRNVAAAFIIKGADRFRIIAYQKAADAIEHLTSEVKDFWDEGKLQDIPGVGPALAQHLDELFRTGKVRHFASIFKGLSPAIFTLLLVPGLGPKRAYQLTKTLKITQAKTAVDELEKAIRAGKVARMEGWGEKSQTEILSAIETYRRGQIKENRMVLPYADELAREVIAYLKRLPEVTRVDVLGSLRRKVATIGDIDLAAATTKPEKVVAAFVKYPKVRKIIDQGPKGATVLLSIGRQVDLRVQTPQAYGAMLQYFTGSKHHNIGLREYSLKQGLSLSEHGIKPLKKVQSSKFKVQSFNKELGLYEFETEEAFYAALGLKYIEPELREDTGEIEAALRQAQGKGSGLPRLVESKDIKGEVHAHSSFDLKPSHDLGSSSLEELLQAAADLNYSYLGISDHNPAVTNQSESEIIRLMKTRREKFEQIYSSWSQRVKTTSLPAGRQVHLFTMLEVDIDPKGKLALPESAFAYVDAVIVSVHSSFNQPKDMMTKRILSGLAHPKAKILGHPTGRLLGSRESYEADWQAIFQFCVEKHKALEINAWPERLDLPDMLVRQAVKQGVKLVIDTDSHAKVQMQLMTYGVDVARRGWAEKKDILNTMEYNDFKRWLKT